MTNRNGKLWQFQFDAANRLTNTITPLNRQTKQTWNNRGLLTSLIEPSGQSAALGYDAKGRLTNRTDAVAATFYRHDANNNVTNILEAGKTNNWTFDANDRATSYRDADGNLIQYRYDLNGNVTNLIYPGGRTVAYAYDRLNRLTNVTDWSNRRTSLEYDLASRVRKVTRPNGTVREIGYDAAGQTTNIVERAVAGEIINLFKFQWNTAARMDWEFTAPLPHAFTPPTRTMTFDDDNRLATFNSLTVVHDLDGNMTSGPLTNSVLASYTYDARNRLLAVGGLQYGYDPAGNRVAITNGANVTRLVVNPNAALSQVLLRIKGGVTNYYVYGAGLLYEVTETASGTNTLTYHFDYRGSTVALTDGNGTVTDRVEYSPYATTTFRSGTNDTPFLFNGRYGVQTDANGLLHMRARYYNPFLCRFVNADPIGFGGGLNHYAYADGNPVSMIDPFGLDGNPVSGLGGTWPSSPYAPGGAYYVPSLPGPVFNTSFGGGVIVGGTAEAGIVSGAGVNVSGGGGVFYDPNTGFNVGGFGGGGGFIGAPGSSLNLPTSPDGSHSGVLGVTAGVGSGVWFSNAGSAAALGGSFDQWNLNLPLLSINYAYSGGTWIVSVAVGKSVGASISTYPTDTISAGGFDLTTGNPIVYNPGK